MKTRAISAALGMLIALPVAAQEMFFYPSQGQSPEQQNRDQGECHAWAVQQTGFDPANPPAPAAAAPAPAPQGGLLRGAARGAAVGAVGGAIAGDAGKGAALGAGTGALLGGMRRRDRSVSRRSSRRPRNRSTSRRSHSSATATTARLPPACRAAATAPVDGRPRCCANSLGDCPHARRQASARSAGEREGRFPTRGCR